MVSVLIKNLLGSKLKIAVSIVGVVLSVFLILTLVGVYSYLNLMMYNVVNSTGADLWVTSEGATGSLHSPSLLPLTLKSEFSSFTNIKQIEPYIRIPFTIRIGGHQELLYITGYTTNSSLGNPFNVIQGKDFVKPGEIIIDYSLAKKYNFKLGDNFAINHRNFKIVGITDNTNLMIATLAFLTFEDSAEFLLSGLTNFFLIKLENLADKISTKETIKENVAGVSVQTDEEVAESYNEEILGSFLPIFYILSMIGYIIGTFVIGLVVYSLTSDKKGEFGLMKAIGARDFDIYKIVLGQSLLLSSSGFLLAILFINPIDNLIRFYVPAFVIQLSLRINIIVFSSSVLIGFIASLIPIKTILDIDPALVFKEV